MKIYHGGYCSIDNPKILKGNFPKDFGAGFYCTELEEQAIRWAKRYDTPVVSVVVIGAMANDQIYNYISDFINNIITREQFWVLAKFKYPTHQICFSTKKALNCLKFLDSKICK